MKVTINSLLGNQQKYVTNSHDITSISDIDKVIRMCITDRSAVLTRYDGKEIPIVSNGTVYTEVYNQKQLLVDWCNLNADEYPTGGLYATSSI